jgi:hypothetical protein
MRKAIIKMDTHLAGWLTQDDKGKEIGTWQVIKPGRKTNTWQTIIWSLLSCKS